MKNLTILFFFLALPLIIGCSGGDSGLDSALNPYGFVISAFNTASTPTLASNDVRGVIRPKAGGLMYVGTAAGVQSFDSSLATVAFAALTTATAAPANVNKLVADGTAGDFYICSDTGLFKYDAVANTLTFDTIIGAKKVLTFTRQSTSVFWVGLEDVTAATESIARVENNVATFIGSTKGNTASAVAEIYVDTDMVMACGTGDTGKGGLFRYDPSSAAFVKQIVTTGLEKGASVFFKVGTNWYAGGPDSGLIVSIDNGNAWNKTNLQNCSPVYFAVETYNILGYQRYWTATDKATYLSYDMVNFAEYSTTKNLAGNAARQIYAGASVWIANNGGLSRLAFDGN